MELDTRMIEEYADLKGNYIVGNSIITLNKEGDNWVCRAVLKVFRGNIFDGGVDTMPTETPLDSDILKNADVSGPTGT